MNGKQRFIEELMASYEMRGRPQLSMTAIERFWELVSHFPVEMIIRAIRDHDSASQYAPQPADIIKALESMDGRPGVEEAWGYVLASSDENTTVVWTEETALASQVCTEQLEAGDKIAARVAFKEKYEKLVTEARKAMKPVKWSISYGDDPRGRDYVVRLAVQAGKLPESHLKMLPPKNDGRVYGLLTGKIQPDKKSKAEQEIAKLRIKLKKDQSKRLSLAEEERERLERQKEETARAIAEYNQGEGNG